MLASVLHAASLYPSGHNGLCGLLRTVRPEPGALGCLSPPKPSEIPDEHESHTSRKPLGW